MARAGLLPCTAAAAPLVAALLAVLLAAPAAGAVCRETNNQDALFGTGQMKLVAEVASPDGG